jgi:hypothetical protein
MRRTEGAFRRIFAIDFGQTPVPVSAIAIVQLADIP